CSFPASRAGVRPTGRAATMSTTWTLRTPHLPALDHRDRAVVPGHRCPAYPFLRHGGRAVAPLRSQLDVRFDSHLQWYCIRYHMRRTWEVALSAITATEARKRLFPLIEQVNNDHMPIEIVHKHGNAVLVSKEDWDAMVETAYLSQGV